MTVQTVMTPYLVHYKHFREYGVFYVNKDDEWQLEIFRSRKNAERFCHMVEANGLERAIEIPGIQMCDKDRKDYYVVFFAEDGSGAIDNYIVGNLNRAQRKLAEIMATV